jgi:hypothetical protein
MQTFEWAILWSNPGRSYLFLAALALFGSASSAQTIRVDSTPGHVAKTFIPTEALAAEDLKGHVDRNTVVAQWLKRRMGWRPLLRACAAEQNLYDLDRAESTADRRAA